jgi:hypothetical protein
VPLDWAVEAPAYWHGLPEHEREKRGNLSSDLCFADEHHFIRGVIEIPIVSYDDCFRWGVWVSLSKESFERALELWDQEVTENEQPRFGWLNTNLPLYPPTLSLKTHVHFRGGNLRPSIELEPTDHPLAVDQRRGITIERVQEIAAALFHRH